MVHVNRAIGVTAATLMCLLFVNHFLIANCSKFAYKKTLYGKTNPIKERRLTTKTSSSSLENNNTSSNDIRSNLEKEKILNKSTTTSAIQLESLENTAIMHTTDATTVEITSSTVTTVQPIPILCTCGIFLASQIKHGHIQSDERPVILNELDYSFPRNAIGQKQCQTKCLETIVKHLPNSANILCATLNRDCRKERAYLFIKNGSPKWHNTNLAAGREYCCKNGQPYQCPLV